MLIKDVNSKKTSKEMQLVENANVTVIGTKFNTFSPYPVCNCVWEQRCSCKKLVMQLYLVCFSETQDTLFCVYAAIYT